MTLRRRHRASLRVVFFGIVLIAACERRPRYDRLAWQDEFSGPAGATFDTTKWKADTGGSGFGNHEHQFYTARPENVSLDGSGHLVITVRAEPASTSDQCWYGRCLYTSARLETRGRFATTYGRIEARIRIPRGPGIWPAFWMLGTNVDTVDWPRSGEIDIMENRGREPGLVYGTVHGPGYSGTQGIGGADTLHAGAYADDFHVYAVEWTASDIRWYVDGHEYDRVRPRDTPRGSKWVFDHPFFLLMNCALDGDWSGHAAGIVLPQRMIVDYVRVYDAR